MLELVFIQGGNRGKVVPLNFQKAHFGRQTTCDYVLEGEELSRVHFSIERRGVFSVLIDNKSTNGTFVNRVPVTETTLRAGDQINVGTHVILVREASPVQLGFRFVVEWKTAQGAQVFQRDTLLIGRHNTCQVQLNEPAVAPMHAELEQRPDGVWITDRSTGTGVHVNGQRVVTQQLRDGDQIVIRPFEITVGLSEEMCSLALRQIQEESATQQFKLPKDYSKVLPSKAEGGHKRYEDIVGPANWMQEKAPIWVPTSDILPNRLRYTVVICALLAALGFAAYAWGARQHSLVIPGPLSKFHTSETFTQQAEAFQFSPQCAACHTAFASVRSDSCKTCHSDLGVVAGRKASVHKDLACTSCHTEHQGAGFEIAKNVANGCLAAGCHATVHEKLRSLAGANRPKMDAVLPAAVAFEAHFDDYEKNPNDDIHLKHIGALSADCKACHNTETPTSAGPKTPRSVMRMRCLGCHGFGPEATLRDRCYGCHFEHKTDAAAFLKKEEIRFSEPRASQVSRAGVNGLVSPGGILVFLATLGAFPILYFGIMVAGYRLEHWSFRGKVMAFISDRRIGKPPVPDIPIDLPVPPPPPPPPPKEGVTVIKRPRIDLDLCVGCATCVHVCPFNVLEIVNEKAIAARMEDCTGFAACAAECPTEAITLVDGGPAQTVELPSYGQDLETNVPGLYLAGEVTGKALIKIAINQGKTVVESILKKRPAPFDGYDVIVVGAGPAGVSTGLAAVKEGLKVLILEQGTIANTVRNYPRQKFIMAEPVMIPLYGPLYMEDTSKETLLEKWEEIIRTTGLGIQQEEKVLHVTKGPDHFVVETAKGKYKGSRVVIAIGRRGTPRKLRVPGEDSSKVTYNLSDAEAYQGKAICVVGGGDSGIEAANGLARVTLSNRVWLVNRGDNFGRAKPRNQKKLQKAIDEGRITVFHNAAVTEIGANTISVKAGQAIETVDNDFVFVMVGGENPKEFLTHCGIEFSQRPLG